jgi:hypothetical protein
MKNLIYSLLVGLAGFALGYWGANYSLYAGIPAAFFFFAICYFILMRRSFSKLTALSQTAMQRMQGAQNNPDPSGQLSLIDQTIIIFEEGLALGKEQFLIAPTVHSQIGTLHYQAAGILMQLRLRETIQGSSGKANSYKSKANARLGKAKEHFIKFYKPWQVKIMKNWHPVAMLAAQENREGNNDRALELLKEIQGAGSDDPLFYGVYAWLLHKCDKKDDALIIVSEGCEKHKKHQSLKDMRNAIQNKKSIDVFGFGQNWFSFFPEQLDQNMVMRMQSQMMANNPEQAQNFNRAQRRALKKRGN